MGARLALSIGVAAALAGLAAASRPRPRSGTLFIRDAIQGNLAEIRLGRLARDKGVGPEVRAFGELLAREHAEANEKALQAAMLLGVIPPAEPMVRHKATVERLSRLPPEAFDHAFAEAMVQEHRRDIREYERAAEGDDAAAAYAREILPKLRHHLETAEVLTREQRTVH